MELILGDTEKLENISLLFMSIQGDSINASHSQNWFLRTAVEAAE